MTKFFKQAFQDMADSAKAQHQVDKESFQAVKMESKANWEEAKAIGNPDVRKAAEQVIRDEQIAEAQERIKAAQERIDAAQMPKA